MGLSEITRWVWNKLAKVDQTSVTEDRASHPLRRNPTHTPIETLVLMTGVLGELAKAAKLWPVSFSLSELAADVFGGGADVLAVLGCHGSSSSAGKMISLSLQCRGSRSLGQV